MNAPFFLFQAISRELERGNAIVPMSLSQCSVDPSYFMNYYKFVNIKLLKMVISRLEILVHLLKEF